MFLVYSLFRFIKLFENSLTLGLSKGLLLDSVDTLGPITRVRRTIDSSVTYEVVQSLCRYTSVKSHRRPVRIRLWILSSQSFLNLSYTRSRVKCESATPKLLLRTPYTSPSVQSRSGFYSSGVGIPSAPL